MVKWRYGCIIIDLGRGKIGYRRDARSVLVASCCSAQSDEVTRNEREGLRVRGGCKWLWRRCSNPQEGKPYSRHRHKSEGHIKIYLTSVSYLTFQPWRWRQHVLPKRRYSSIDLHSVTTQWTTIVTLTTVKIPDVDNKWLQHLMWQS
jgi:hypothetical protein